MSSYLLKYLPNYYKTSNVMINMTSAEDSETQLFNTRLNETLNQFFVDTSTYTLERWEKDLGIPVNNSKPDDYRRSVIKSKLRGSGTITVSLIKNVSESFTNGEVEVIEQPSLYSFTIKFVGTIGIPPNLEDLQNAIEEIKPAHLAIVYEMIYNTHGFISGFTHSHLSSYTHQQLRETEVV